MKVMIIDDEPVNVRGISKHVKWAQLGYTTVTGSYSTKDALKLLSEDTYDLVITDINMPECNGLELIRRIYHLGKTPDVIIVSGYNEFTYAQEAIRLGVHAYILKPVKPEEIEENIIVLSEKRNHEIRERNTTEVMERLHELNRGVEIEATMEARKKIHPTIQKVLLYINKNYVNQITLQNIAEVYMINESYFSALFKKEMGVNLSCYLQRYRLDRAMELIKNSDLRINEISYRVGYQNPCYFTELFKKQYNQTPSEIRSE